MLFAKSLRDSLEVGYQTVLSLIDGEKAWELEDYHPDSIYDGLNDILRWCVSGEIELKLSDGRELVLELPTTDRTNLLRKWHKVHNFHWIHTPEEEDEEGLLVYVDSVVERVNKVLQRMQAN